MNWEKSCGAIVFTRQEGRLLFVVVRENSGNYSFPKGHVEGDETELETARREVFEEIGLRPAFVEGFRQTDEYDLAEKPGTRKQVVYFLAEYGNQPLIPQPSEICQIRLLPYEEALSCFWHEGTRQALTEAYRFLTR